MKPALTLALWLFGASGCTSFEGLEPSGPSTTSSGSGTGGAGGQAPMGPSPLLPELDAAHLCSLVFRCPTLAGSIALSIGVPLATLDDAALPATLNYSACLDWLRLPLLAGHLGFEAAQDLLVCMSANTTCEGAAACAPREVLSPTAPECQAQIGRRCEDGDVVDCDLGMRHRCDGSAFAPGSQCQSGTLGEVGCAVGGCQTEEQSCDGELHFACEADGLRSGLSCALFGLACSLEPACSGRAGPSTCATLGKQRCSADGRLAQSCTVLTAGGPFNAEVSCEAMGRSCQMEGGERARCVSPSDLCSPSDPNQNLCDGGEIQVCIGGTPTRIDCGKIGKSCVASSPDGTRSAHCE